MFRAVLCSSSGGQIVLLQHLVSSLSVKGRTVCRLRADSVRSQIWGRQVFVSALHNADNRPATNSPDIIVLNTVVLLQTERLVNQVLSGLLPRGKVTGHWSWSLTFIWRCSWQRARLNTYFPARLLFIARKQLQGQFHVSGVATFYQTKLRHISGAINVP